MSLLSISWIEMTLSDAIGRWTIVSPCIVGASRYSFPLNLTLQSFFLVVQLLRWSLGEASYYPPFLGIIKEILSRGPQVVDMERWGIDWLMMSTYTLTHDVHLHRWKPTSPPRFSGSSCWHPPHQLVSERQWVLLHEVQVRYRGMCHFHTWVFWTCCI